jgi:hypothetical protein
MVRQDVLQVRFRRRGNPNWGSGAMAPLPSLPTAFELEARRLHLRPDDYVGSAELHAWCERNRNRCYIPEWLLDAWGIAVDADLTGTA